MGLTAMLTNYNPACRSELKLLIIKSFSFVETVKEASAVCRSFLDGVVIFLFSFSPFFMFFILLLLKSKFIFSKS